MTFNKLAGLSLVVAVVLGLVSGLLTPGGFLIDPGDSADFAEAAAIMGDNAQLSQIVTTGFVIAVVLYWFGLSTLQRAFGGGSVMDRVSSFALKVFLFGYAFLIVELSLRHVLTHVLEHGVGSSAAEEQMMATTIFTASVALHFAFLYVTSIGSTIFGCGLARRCEGMSIYKLAAMGLALTGALSFVVLMIAEHVPEIDLNGVAVIGNLVLFFGSFCILVIGIGIMQGRREFVGEEAAV